jgi:peptidyl-prolyl cis-trans isomerase C
MVVARVGESTLTLCDFARRIGMQNQYLRARFSAPEQRRALLRAWVDSELLAAEARARGLDRDPAVRHAITSQLARQLESELRGQVQPPVITEAEVERYYNEHRAEYDTPEQVRASHIVTGSRAQAERILAEARAHASDDSFWRELARRESADAATRDIGGDLGFFTQDGGQTVPPEVARAAFALRNPGDVSPQVVESAHGGPGHGPGFHVVRFVARREALHRTLDEVRRPIRNRLWRERFDAAQDEAVRSLIQRLRREARVTIDEGALAQVRLDLPPPGTPAAIPGAPPASPLVPPGVVPPPPAAGAPGAPR